MRRTPLTHRATALLSRRLPARLDTIPAGSETATWRGPMRSAHSAMSFDADPRRVKAARRMTAAVLGRAGVRDRDVVGTVQLLVSEIVTNAIVHGNANSISFQITCDTVGDVLIEVDDHSSGAPEVQEAGPDDEGGRGMQLVTYLASDWGRKGTRTWCTYAVRRC